ncbi:diguanylate cyclase [Paenibacillus sp. HJL G12]|uniref:Diguanylate cyclase n=1 Tax=Paenibacillus dendrobii TaxID=2691084 RepID=A0A7X3IDN6_9BACL|nr:GGDEF domain-containing protein [Paenibacillus dendrobii]MWV42009.1 diguanylate cyclase [Paenibacillus dendrobii]
MAWIDFVLFILLFALWVYVFVSVTITKLHKAYLIFHFFMMFWPFCQFAIKATENSTVQYFYVLLAFVDMGLLAVGWLFFTLLLTNHSLPSRKTSLLIPLPALIGALASIINPNSWFVQPVNGGYFQRTYGPIFWITAPILIGYGIVSLYIIYQTLVSDNAPRIKKQVKQVLRGIVVVIAFICADILVNVVFPFSQQVIPGLTSLGILLSAVYFVIAIHRDKVFDLVNIAHQDIINTISNGILVLDDNERIVEINRTLAPFLKLNIGDRFEISNIFPERGTAEKWEIFINTYLEYPMKRAEIDILYLQNDPCYVQIQVSPILVSGTRVGRIVTFQDMTEIRRLIDETSLQNEILQERNQSLITIQQELHLTNQKLQEMAVTDGLTGCYNRHYLTQQLEHEVNKNIENQIPFSILLLDIDFFKLINDNYGHMVGDEVICGTVSLIRQTLRPSDILARFGGEEFIIYLPDTASEGASRLAEQILNTVESNAIRVPHSIQTLSITISIGLLSIHQFPVDNPLNSKDTLNDMFQSVDQVLYQAKREGRNRIASLVK